MALSPGLFTQRTIMKTDAKTEPRSRRLKPALSKPNDRLTYGYLRVARVRATMRRLKPAAAVVLF